jgi:hypothetical protein
MSLLSPKIDPFSSFTINLGPLYVERVFDSLLTRQGVKDVIRMSAIVRLENYLRFLKQISSISHPRQYVIIQFYKGHFYQQLANLWINRENTTHFQEKALCYYQTYLELIERPDESQYYAQWQTGILQYNLRYPWPEVEGSLVKASAIDPVRGEAVKKIIEHHSQNKEWAKAYPYSSYAVKKFFEKNPAATRRWFIDFDAYNWKVINAHLTICDQLGYHVEADKFYDQIKYVTNGTILDKAVPEHIEL